jgi:hypothetical protein
MRLARIVTATAAAAAGASAAAFIPAAPARAEEATRNVAGSIQFDYLAVPTERIARQQALDGATVEVSLKLAMDFSRNLSANVKVCYACHGFEVGMAFFDLRVADQLNVRVGRFTPSFGEYQLRHDPANHRTSDNPLPYDMGRMLRLREWNMSVLPAPWVDNGVEVSGTQFFRGGTSQVDYALYAIGGPRGPAGGFDFNFVSSRSPSSYYIDNNSLPSVGGRLALTLGFGESALSLGASGMGGTWDPDNKLRFLILGADLVLRIDALFIRAEYLVRRTEFALGDNPSGTLRYGPGPDGRYDTFWVKDGGYTEVELPAGRFDFVVRLDGMRRRGNILQSSPLDANSFILRFTAGMTIRLVEALRLKVSAELYQFSEFPTELATHVGLAGPF